MSKFLQKVLAVSLALLLLNLQTYASPFGSIDFSDDAQELIEFNEDAIYNEFQEIEALSEILTTENISAEEISDNDLLKNVNLAASTLPLAADEEGTAESPLGIPPFLWGCILSWVGVLLVYLLTEENKDLTKKALWGCVAGGAAYVLFYVIIYGGLFAASTASTVSTGYYY